MTQNWNSEALGTAENSGLENGICEITTRGLGNVQIFYIARAQSFWVCLATFSLPSPSWFA